MTSIDLQRDAPVSAHVPAAEALVEEFAGLMRVVHAHKAASSTRSAHGLLFPLDHHGPLRTTALAELVHTDPSTTSRQVAELVGEGLVERQGDPADRRASLIAVSGAGRDAVAAMRRERAEQFAGALSDWSVEEITAFTATFRRFREALAAALPTSPCAPSSEEQS